MDKTYIIAELSANHNNDIDLALKTIKAMEEAGADAVKVQTYTADSLAINVENEYYKKKTEGLWKGYRPYELYQEASLPYEWHEKLQKATHDLGMEFFSSPFDLKGVDFLEGLNVPRYKIASFEITDTPLIAYAASKGKPMIISTGVAEEKDIENAIECCKNVGNNDITILKCTSNYPSKISDANLATMVDMKTRFNVKVGLSDHTEGSVVPCAAVALGASVVEKHFILDRQLGGPDSAFSMEPGEFKSMVEAVRKTEMTIGGIQYSVSEKDKLRRRSLFTTKNISQGESLTRDNIRSVRPGHGLHPSEIENLIGKKVSADLKKGTPLRWEDIDI